MACKDTCGDAVCCGFSKKRWENDPVWARVLQMTGGVARCVFSVTVMNRRVFIDRVGDTNAVAIQNALWFHSFLGTGVYLFYSDVLKGMCTRKRVVFSVYGAVTSNMTSLLILALMKRMLPDAVLDRNWLRGVLGFLVAVGVMNIGRIYIDSIDRCLEDKKKE